MISDHSSKGESDCMGPWVPKPNLPYHHLGTLPLLEKTVTFTAAVYHMNLHKEPMLCPDYDSQKKEKHFLSAND